jgi:tetratricopeptide (TPR) repeat protein
MNRSIGRPSRHLTRWILAALALVHLLAFGAYSLHERQAHLVTLYLDARDQWRDGHLDAAAAEYTTFLVRRAGTAWPVVLYPHFPDEATGWYLLGRVETDRHHVEDALASFERALALDPKRGRREYRDLLLRSGRGAALVAYAREEVRADPASPIAAKDLGAGLLASGQPALAVDAYAQALALLPAWRARFDPAAPLGLTGEEADILNLLSVAARLAGDPRRADAACLRAGSTPPRAPRLDRLCAAYGEAAAGDREAATRLLVTYPPPAPEHEALVAAIVTPP